MKLTANQFKKFFPYLPRQCVNVSMSNRQLVNAILCVTENGLEWRTLPKEFGNWHTVYVRMNCWSKNGVIRRLPEALQTESIIRTRMEEVCLGTTIVKVQLNETDASKTRKQAIGDPGEVLQSKFIWSPHLTVRL